MQRERVKTDIDARTVVTEVRSLVVDLGSSDGDRLLGSSRRVVAGVLVVVSSSDRKVESALDRLVDSSVQSRALSSTQTHAGNRPLVGSVPGLDKLGFGSLGLLDSRLGSEQNSERNKTGWMSTATRCERRKVLTHQQHQTWIQIRWIPRL